MVEISWKDSTLPKEKEIVSRQKVVQDQGKQKQGKSNKICKHYTHQELPTLSENKVF